MAIITIPGRAGIAKSIKNSPLFIAWGTDSDEWTSSEKVAEDPARDSLFNRPVAKVIKST